VNVNEQNKLSDIISLSIVPLSVFSIQYQSVYPIGNTAFWWIIKLLILIVFWRGSLRYVTICNRKIIRIVLLYILWNVISIFRGLLIAETYWDWKTLINNSFGILMPIIAFVTTNPQIVQKILSFYLICITVICDICFYSRFRCFWFLFNSS
jgi:hypothetical protein